ncbi:MAG: alpha/beta hydrolase [Planctomycetales bacterium]
MFVIRHSPLLLLALTGCASLGVPSPLASLEHGLLYQPAPVTLQDLHATRALRTLEFEEAAFTAEDGTRLSGLFAPHEHPRAVALFAHGNAGNVFTWAETARELRDRHGLSVLLFDYRGYGHSEGTPSEHGLIQDARAARKWLAARTGVAETDIVLIGRSLGGAVVVQLAADDGARGLVLQSTFTSAPDVGNVHASWLLPRLTMQNRFESLKRIGDYRGPLLVSHGDADEVIPYEHGRMLCEAAPGPKRFVTIPGGRHNDLLGADYPRALDEFIDSLPPTARAERSPE